MIKKLKPIIYIYRCLNAFFLYANAILGALYFFSLLNKRHAKLLYLETRKIGHFLTPIDIYLREVEIGKHLNIESLLIVHDRQVCNRFLLDRLSQNFYLSKFFALRAFCRVANRTRIFESKFVSWRFWEQYDWWQTFDVHDCLRSTRSVLIDDDFTRELTDYFDLKVPPNFGEVDRPLAVVSGRDAEFHGDKQFFRNTSKNTLEHLISLLLEHGFKVIRAGRKVGFELDISSKYFLDLPLSGLSDDKMDISLAASADLYFTNVSGIDSFYHVFGVPSYAYDVAEWGYSNRFTNQLRIVLPKQIRRTKGYHCLRSTDLIEAIDAGVGFFGSETEYQQLGIVSIHSDKNRVEKFVSECLEDYKDEITGALPWTEYPSSWFCKPDHEQVQAGSPVKISSIFNTELHLVDVV